MITFHLRRQLNADQKCTTHFIFKISKETRILFYLLKTLYQLNSPNSIQTQSLLLSNRFPKNKCGESSNLISKTKSDKKEIIETF